MIKMFCSHADFTLGLLGRPDFYFMLSRFYINIDSGLFGPSIGFLTTVFVETDTKYFLGLPCGFLTLASVETN